MNPLDEVAIKRKIINMLLDCFDPTYQLNYVNLQDKLEELGKIEAELLKLDTVVD